MNRTVHNIVINFTASGPYILTHNDDIANDSVTMETNLP